MKILFISDTHCRHEEVKIPQNVDMVVHCGDCSNSRPLNLSHKEISNFFEWYNKIDLPKIYVPGNHDADIYNFPAMYKQNYPNVRFLINEYWEYDGISFYGMPHTPEFRLWYFVYKRYDSRWVDQIPKCDVLITHGPPYLIKDIADNHTNVGCELLTNKVLEMQPKVHAFGHIHSNTNIDNFGIFEYNNTKFVNCAMLKHNGEFIQEGVVINV